MHGERPGSFVVLISSVLWSTGPLLVAMGVVVRIRASQYYVCRQETLRVDSDSFLWLVCTVPRESIQFFMRHLSTHLACRVDR